MTPFLLLLLAALALGKIYDRCELARELKFVQGAPAHQVATWVCIAEHESQYNTSIVGHMSGDGSGDHGIFQINDKFWCSPPGKGYACGLTCAELEDDDISDDFFCAQRIYKEHKTLSGDGFNAWAVYRPHCKGAKAERYVKDCFNDSDELKPSVASDLSTASPPLFAHGFFGTAAGRANKVYSTSTTTSTPRPPFDAFFTPTSTSNFNPSVSSSAFFTPSRAVSFVPTTSRPTTNRFLTFDPTATVPTRVVYIGGRSSIFASSAPSTTESSFFTPSTTGFSFFPPTPTASSVYQGSSVGSLVNNPVFIFNGVKWY